MKWLVLIVVVLILRDGYMTYINHRDRQLQLARHSKQIVERSKQETLRFQSFIDSLQQAKKGS